MGTIAPHKGKELALILSGAKPFAVIEKRKDPRQYFDAGAIDKKGITVQYIETESGPEVIVSRQRALVAEYQALVVDGIARLGAKGFHRAMGRLFGYKPADVEEFINSEINCNCTKCKGVKL